MLHSGSRPLILLRCGRAHQCPVQIDRRCGRRTRPLQHYSGPRRVCVKSLYWRRRCSSRRIRCCRRPCCTPAVVVQSYVIDQQRRWSAYQSRWQYIACCRGTRPHGNPLHWGAVRMLIQSPCHASLAAYLRSYSPFDIKAIGRVRRRRPFQPNRIAHALRRKIRHHFGQVQRWGHRRTGTGAARSYCGDRPQARNGPSAQTIFSLHC